MFIIEIWAFIPRIKEVKSFLYKITNTMLISEFIRNYYKN